MFGKCMQGQRSIYQEDGSLTRGHKNVTVRSQYKGGFEGHHPNCEAKC